MKKEKQILDYSDKEIRDLVQKIMEDGQVVLYDQNLSLRELTEACARFGNVEENDYFMNPPEAPAISIVSGERNEQGRQIGIFGDAELEWHANGIGRHYFDELCVGLYCVTECIDTTLSLLNQEKAFKDLSEEDKNYYRNIEIRLDSSGPRARLWPDDDSYTDQGESTLRTGQEFYKEDIDRRPLVAKHPVDGAEYIYFMVPYIVQAWYKDGTEVEDFDEFYNTLYSKIVRSKHIFHHVFRKGDLLLMDQLKTIHRRSPVKKKERKLWRTAFDYTKSSSMIPFPNIKTAIDPDTKTQHVPLKEEYSFKDMAYLDSPEALKLFEIQADIIIEKQCKGIVDIGCRHGPVVKLLHDRGYTDFNYMGFDTSQEPIDIATETWKKYSNIEFRHGSWNDESIMTVDFAVDQVIWSGVLLYRPDDHYDFFDKITNQFYKSKNAIIQEPLPWQRHWRHYLKLNRISDNLSLYRKNCRTITEHELDLEIFAGRRIILDITL